MQQHSPSIQEYGHQSITIFDETVLLYIDIYKQSFNKSFQILKRPVYRYHPNGIYACLASSLDMTKKFTQETPR